MDNKTFGAKLKQLRKSKGYTQEFLAEKADIDAKHLSKIENGKYYPTHLTLNKLLNALNLTVEDAGLNLEKLQINTNPLYSKAIQILNSAKSDKELEIYLDTLKCSQKIINKYTE